MNNMPANRNTHTCQKQGNISMCFGYMYTCDHCRCFHGHQFSFFNGFAWNVFNLKTPFKEQKKKMKFGEFLVDKQVNPIPPDLCYMYFF